jgi:hypothetical protein
MIETEQQTICKRPGCNNPIEQKDIGPYKKIYCSNACKQAVYRASHHNVTVDTEAQQRIAELEQELEQTRQGRDQVQQRMAEYVSTTNEKIGQLVSELARYRQIVDLSDRQKMLAQFMLVGEEIGYKSLWSVDVGLGAHAWGTFTQTADDEHLAAAIVAARHVWKQLADLQTTTAVEKQEKIITDLRQKLRECEKRTAS